ncbi:MAG: hypothetical protein GC136_02715 [Alphaproteobacteria bacterium]|nr:hypothetical protein [Alphaproteobacteria bacterium]
MLADIPAPPPKKDPAPPENLAGKIKARIQKIITGNGLKPAEVEVSITEWYQYDIPAELVITLQQESAVEHIPGKVAKGEVIENKARFEQMVAQTYANLTGDAGLMESFTKDVQAHTINFVQQESGQIPAQYNRVLTVHEKCTKCLGNGADTCHTCAARGQVTCNGCSASGRTICNYCRGTGGVQQGANRVSCNTCGGQGRVVCSLCRGAGRITCNHCHGKGKITCGPCQGSGWFSEVMTIVFSWASAWHLVMPEVRASLQRLLQRGWKKFYEAKEIKLLPVEGPVTESPPVPSRLIYVSQIEAEAGEATIKLGQMDVPASVLGVEGRLFDIPNFLDGIAKKELQRLQKALQGKGHLLQAVRQALRLRMVNEAFQCALAGAKTATPERQLLRLYPHGMSALAARKLTEFAAAAWQKLTEKSRSASLMAMFFAGVLLQGGYWFAPVLGLPSFATQYHGTTLHVADAGAFFVTLLIAFMVKPLVFALSTKRLRRVLGLNVKAASEKSGGALMVSALLAALFAACFWWFRWKTGA